MKRPTVRDAGKRGEHGQVNQLAAGHTGTCPLRSRVPVTGEVEVDESQLQ